ncbi:hypothetical protein GYMLUDRAFT_33188 [Collybiopsis luxurians FD-317 M1]|nr:hypothetical protein GYMLUDRAFT_33188 [Collybiopsis luxurians FD-317 M1]
MIYQLPRLALHLRALPDDSDTSGSSSANIPDQESGQVAHSGSLGHRMIGVIIVLVLAFLIFILWVVFAKWPRRRLRRWGCTCLPAPHDEVEDVEGNTKEKAVRRQDSDQRPQSWVISHNEMASQQPGDAGDGFGLERSDTRESERSKHLSPWEGDESNKVQKEILQS